MKPNNDKREANETNMRSQCTTYPPHPIHNPLPENEAVWKCDFPLPTAILPHQGNRSDCEKKEFIIRGY